MFKTRRFATVGLSTTLLMIPTITSTPSALANPSPITTTMRLWGPDRYATAVAVSQRAFHAPHDTVVIASGEDFPDAMAAGTAAGRLEAPLLLTRKATLPGVVAAELRRLSPGQIYLVGGTGAVSAAVATTLASSAPHVHVTRISGSDRYGTAEAVARFTAGGVFKRAFVVSGETFADGPAGGTAAATVNGPLLLTARTSLPAATRRALAAGKPDSVILVGGTGVMAAAVESQIKTLLPQAVVHRFAGADRYATADLVFDDLFSDQPAGIAFYVSGTGFADALTAIPAAAISNRPLGAFGAPVLPTRTACHPAPTWKWVQRIAPRVAVGGQAVVYSGTARC